MNAPIVSDYPHAAPISDTGMEMACGNLKIIIAQSGSFKIDGEDRTAFIVGSRTTPIGVSYADNPVCSEWSVLLKTDR